MQWILLVLVLIGGGRNENIETVDLIEFNTYLRHDGSIHFEQVILWDWSPDYRRYQVVAWVFVNRLYCGPVKIGPWYHICWLDESSKVYRIRAGAYRETKTHVDPERENIKLWPSESRRKLW